ncbi:MAG TPA: hypothetical protein HPP87_08165 [Planctomycetes bacterium]|nr:hypothetical protein [Planctomycetota bacterium]HIJ71322.1 hypothetical protein [Planctomycetota bacterium]
MINFVRQLIAAPLRVLLWICGFVPLFDRLRLMQLIWAISTDPADAAGVLTLTASAKGIAQAHNRAEKMFATHPDSQIAATMGWLQIHHARNLPEASRWLKKARQVDCDDSALLSLELFLSEHLDEYDTQEVVERILARNDLPMSTTRDALLADGRRLLKEKRWTEAQAVADKILTVEENPQARWIGWVTAIINGNDALAQTQLSIAGGKMSDAALRGFVALGWLYMGDSERAARVLQEARTEGAGVGLINKDLARFLGGNFQETG